MKFCPEIAILEAYVLYSSNQETLERIRVIKHAVDEIVNGLIQSRSAREKTYWNYNICHVLYRKLTSTSYVKSDESHYDKDSCHISTMPAFSKSVFLELCVNCKWENHIIKIIEAEDWIIVRPFIVDILGYVRSNDYKSDYGKLVYEILQFVFNDLTLAQKPSRKLENETDESLDHAGLPDYSDQEFMTTCLGNLSNSTSCIVHGNHHWQILVALLRLFNVLNGENTTTLRQSNQVTTPFGWELVYRDIDGFEEIDVVFMENCRNWLEIFSRVDKEKEFVQNVRTSLCHLLNNWWDDFRKYFFGDIINIYTEASQLRQLLHNYQFTCSLTTCLRSCTSLSELEENVLLKLTDLLRECKQFVSKERKKNALFVEVERIELALKFVEEKTEGFEDCLYWLLTESFLGGSILLNDRFLMLLKNNLTTMKQPIFYRTFIELLLQKTNQQDLFSYARSQQVLDISASIFKEMSCLDRNAVLSALLRERASENAIAGLFPEISNFDQQITSCFNKLVNSKDDTEGILGEICIMLIQRPSEVIMKCLSNAVRNKSQTPTMIKVLQSLPCIGRCQSKENPRLSHLCHAITTVLMGSVKCQEKLDLKIFIRSIFKLQDTSPSPMKCLNSDEFLSMVLLPNMNWLLSMHGTHDDHTLLLQVVELLEITLEHQKELSTEVVFPLLLCSCKIIDYCLELWTEQTRMAGIKETCLRIVEKTIKIKKLDLVKSAYIEWFCVKIEQLHWTTILYLDGFLPMTWIQNQVPTNVLSIFQSQSTQTNTENCSVMEAADIILNILLVVRISDHFLNVCCKKIYLLLSRLPCDVGPIIGTVLTQVLKNSTLAEWMRICHFLARLADIFDLPMRIYMLKRIPMHLSLGDMNKPIGVSQLLVDAMCLLCQECCSPCRQMNQTCSNGKHWHNQVKCFASVIKNCILEYVIGAKSTQLFVLSQLFGHISATMTLVPVSCHEQLLTLALSILTRYRETMTRDITQVSKSPHLTHLKDNEYSMFAKKNNSFVHQMSSNTLKQGIMMWTIHCHQGASDSLNKKLNEICCEY